MKGYRTIIFSSAMTLIGLLGFKISPDTASHWTDVFFSIWGIGAILIRQITTTPVGGIALVQSPGLSADDAAKLRQDIMTLLQHSGVSLQAAALTANLSQKIDAISGAVQAIAAAVPPAGNPPPSGTVADPAVPAVVPAPEDGGGPALAPSVSTPAQPIASDPVAAPAPAAAVIAEDIAVAARIAPQILAAL